MILEMHEQEQFLADMLEKAVTLVNTIEERYREIAFPLILQALINNNEATLTKNQLTQGSRCHPE